MKKNPTLTTPLLVFIIFLLMLAAKLGEKKIIATGGNVYLSAIIVQVLIFIIPAAVFCRINGIDYLAHSNIKLFPPSEFGAVVVTALTAALGTTLIRYGQIYLFGLKSPTGTLFPAYLGANIETDQMLPAAMAFALIPAICEELVFRVITLTEYNGSGLNAVSASFASVLMSAMLPMSFELIPIYIFSGICYCALTYVTRSALTAFISHILLNAYLIFGEKYVFNALSNPANKFTSLFTILVLFLISAAFMFAEFERIMNLSATNGTPTPSYLLVKTDDSTPDVSASEYSENIRRGGVSDNFRNCVEIFFSPTMLLCILIFVISMFGLF
ncbi:MAG: CPBP family intramembrane metalloprotease [Firmicutes bacterium]|nr:CPBP family intramembrane metalloprotease [Candidatus Colimorpha enterica]